MRKDAILALFIRVVDGDTAIIQILRHAGHNRYAYGSQERVRWRSYNAPEHNARGGQRATTHHRQQVLGMRRWLTVHARDVFGRLVVT